MATMDQAYYYYKIYDDYNELYNYYMDEYKETRESSYLQLYHILKFVQDNVFYLDAAINELDGVISDINKYFVLDGKGVDDGQVASIRDVLLEHKKDLNNKYMPEAEELLKKRITEVVECINKYKELKDEYWSKYINEINEVRMNGGA